MSRSPDETLKVMQRLRRIEGQVRGLQRMVEEDRYCGDILNQIAATRQALTSTARVVMRRHLETCVTEALRSGDADRADRTIDELMTLMSKRLGV